MKILALGDTHGRDLWKEIVKTESFDVCVFMGDYFDSFDLDADTQIQNFKDIIAYKKQNPQSVILLTGNHELHYMLSEERYSGYNTHRAFDISEVLQHNRKHLQKAYQYNELLFTHAGVTKTWARKHKLDLQFVADAINVLPDSAFAFAVEGATSGYGDNKHQSCLWVRPASLAADAIDGFIQIVGHTDVGGVITYSEEVVLIDAIAHRQYIIIDEEEVAVKQI